MCYQDLLTDDGDCIDSKIGRFTIYIIIRLALKFNNNKIVKVEKDETK